MCGLWFLVLLVSSLVVSVISDTTNSKLSDSEDVKFKTGFPYEQYGGRLPSYETPLYGNPQGNNYGQLSAWPSNQYQQYPSPVSYPSYELPQQSYSPYSFNPYQSYQSYQPIPYNYYPQYGTNTYGAQYPVSQGMGYPITNYQTGTNPVPSIPVGRSADSDFVRMLGVPKVYEVIPADEDEPKATLPTDRNQQNVPTVYLPSQGADNQGFYGNYPMNPYPNNQYYDPFANVPTEIIDVDYPVDFKSSGAVATPQDYKPHVKVTSHSENSGISAIPIVKTQSSVVTTKPMHAVITRTYDSSKGNSPEIKVVKFDDSGSNTPEIRVVTFEDGKVVNQEIHGVESEEESEPELEESEDNVIPEVTITDENEDEEPQNVSSWF